jgi:pimeloyl-ACP methyl ester carboxylesterase
LTGRDIAVELEGGRRVTVEVAGAENGAPVFLLHGTPGSRHGPKPRSIALFRLGVRLVTYDRPGYGGSTRVAGRRVRDAAADVAAIADALGIQEFCVVGRSGGGPHALACAALLGDRVRRAAVLVGLAPSNAPGLDWFDGMGDGNTDEFSTADSDSSRLAERLRLRSDRIRRDPQFLVEGLLRQMAEPDRRFVERPDIRRLLGLTYAEALRDGPWGWIDDVLAFRNDWGFELDAIRCPVRLWHGADDNFAPVGHSRWLGRHIPTAEIQVEMDKAHFGAVEALPKILMWLRAVPPPTVAHAA